MLIGALGDIHGDFASLERIMRDQRDVTAWLCVGDVADDEGSYVAPIAPLYWIKGNNEDFDFIERARAGSTLPNLHYLPNGALTRIASLAVAGLGGTLAPTWYETAAVDLPGPKRAGSRDDKRRHFVREEVEACKSLVDVDVFLTHEAPRPYLVEAGRDSGRSSARKVDAGKTPINEVLAAMRPRLHLFGHHHRFTEAERQGVRSIGLDQIARSYLIIDAATLDYEKVDG